MTQVIWAPRAIQDVEAIRAYVACDSAHYGALVVERIVAAVERLKDSPRSGRVVPELGDESIREVIRGNYRIVYRLRHDIAEDRDRVPWGAPVPNRLRAMTSQRRTSRRTRGGFALLSRRGLSAAFGGLSLARSARGSPCTVA